MNRALVLVAALAALAAIPFAPSTVSAQEVVVVPAPPQAQVQVQVPAPPQYGPRQPVQQQYVQPQYAQPQYAQPAVERPTRQTSRPNLGLTISGAVLFGVSWILHAALVSPLAGYSISEGLQPEWEDIRWLGAIPIAGPWAQLAVLPTALGEDSWSPYLIIDGILQAAGLTLLILGLTLQQTSTEYVANELPDFAIVPTAGQNGGGLAALGRF